MIYVEARYCPFLLIPDSLSQVDYLEGAKFKQHHTTKDISPVQIVEAVNRGFYRGEKDFKIICRTILCCIRGKPEWSSQILELCVQFKDKGVVGIDIAGDEAGEKPIDEEGFGKFITTKFKGFI